MASYAKQAADKEMEKTAQRIRARAGRRCGELYKEIEKGHGKNKGNRAADCPISITRKDAAESVGHTPGQMKQKIRLANIPAEEFEALIESDNPPTVSQLAEIGKAKKPIPLYEKQGVTK